MRKCKAKISELFFFLEKIRYRQNWISLFSIGYETQDVFRGPRGGYQNGPSPLVNAPFREPTVNSLLTEPVVNPILVRGRTNGWTGFSFSFSFSLLGTPEKREDEKNTRMKVGTRWQLIFHPSTWMWSVSESELLLPLGVRSLVEWIKLFALELRQGCCGDCPGTVGSTRPEQGEGEQQRESYV